MTTKALPPNPTRFANVYLFHGKGGSPDGAVLNLEAILQHAYYDVRFKRPCLPHRMPDVTAEESLDYVVLQYRNTMLPNSLIVGIGLGGLLAVRLQELSPHLDLSVFAINAPTSENEVKISSIHPLFAAAPNLLQSNLVALYSSLDKEIKGRVNWSDFTPWAFDMPMLRYHDTDLCKYAVCYLISRFMQGRDMTTEVNNLFPTDAELLK